MLSDDKKKMLKAMEEMETEAAKENCRSYAEQVLKAKRLQGRRRNRQGDGYLHVEEKTPEGRGGGDSHSTAQPRRERLG